MSRNLQVDLTGLHSGSHGIDSERTTLAAVHADTARDVDAAHAGWVGNSAHALSAMAQTWRDAGAAHSERMDDHAHDMRVTAAIMRHIDARNAAALRALDFGGADGAP